MNNHYDRLILSSDDSRPVRITITSRQSETSFPGRVESSLFGNFWITEEDFDEANDPNAPVTPENAPEALEYAIDDMIDRDTDGYGFDDYEDLPNDGEEYSETEYGGDDDAADLWETIGELFRMLDERAKERGDDDEDAAVMRLLGKMEKHVRPDGGIDLEIAYEEDTGTDTVKTVIHLSSMEPGLVTISRLGPLTGMIVCEEGVRHTSTYSTPYGFLELAVFGRKCESDVTFAGGGTITLNYLVEFHGTDMQYTEMRIDVEVL